MYFDHLRLEGGDCNVRNIEINIIVGQCINDKLWGIIIITRLNKKE